jgi:hypothetical protein
MDNPKKKKQDRKLLATKQPWEVSNIQKTWKVTKKQLIEIVKIVGRSQKKIKAYLEENGFEKKPVKDQKFKNTAPHGKDTR